MGTSFGTAAQSASTAANSANREVGATSQSAIQNLRSTKADDSKMQSFSDQKQQMINDTLRFVDQKSAGLSSTMGDSVNNADKVANSITAGLTSFANMTTKAGTPEALSFLSGLGLEFKAGVQAQAGTSYSAEEVSTALQTLGLEKSAADSLSKNEEFVSQLAQTATEANQKSSSFSVLTDVSQSDTEALQEAYKRAQQYQQVEGITNNATRSAESNVSFGTTDFIKSEEQDSQALEAIRKTGMLSQNEQLGLLTKGMSLQQQNEITDGFQKYSDANGFSNASYKERQAMLEDYISSQKEGGVDFSAGEKALSKEVKNVNENFQKTLDRTMSETGGFGNERNAIQSFLLDKLKDTGDFQITGNYQQDQSAIRKFDDNVDMLSEYIKSPEKIDYLQNMSEDLVSIGRKGENVVDEGNNTISTVNDKARLTSDGNGSPVFEGERRTAFNEDYEAKAEKIRNNSSASDVEVRSIEDISNLGKVDTSELDKRFSDVRNLTDNLDELKSAKTSVAPYSLNMSESYEQQTKGYLDDLPINANLREDTRELFDAMKTDQFDERLINGFKVMDSGASSADLSLKDENDLRLAQAYTATQNNDGLRDFNNIAQQLLNIDPETSGLNNIQRMNVESNSRFFTDEGKMIQSQMNANNGALNERYKTDFDTTRDFISRSATELGLQPEENYSGEGRGVPSNVPRMGVDTAQYINDGELEKAFNNLKDGNVNRDGNETKLLTVAAAEMVKYGDDTQKENGENILKAVSAYKDSGGDFDKFEELYDKYTGKDSEFGNGPLNDENKERDQVFNPSDIFNNAGPSNYVMDNSSSQKESDVKIDVESNDKKPSNDRGFNQADIFNNIGSSNYVLNNTNGRNS